MLERSAVRRVFACGLRSLAQVAGFGAARGNLAFLPIIALISWIVIAGVRARLVEFRDWLAYAPVGTMLSAASLLEAVNESLEEEQGTELGDGPETGHGSRHVRLAGAAVARAGRDSNRRPRAR